MSSILPPTAGDTRGTYLRRLREAASMSGRELDAAARISIGSVAHVEAGKRTNIGDAIYTAIAAALSVDPSAVLALPVTPPAEAASLAPVEANGEMLASVDCTLIDRSDLNPRRSFDADSITTLADSIAEHGFIQPIMLRPRADAPGRYWIVVGERRWRAACLLQEQRERYGRGDDPVLIPARIRAMSDREHLEIALIENMHRTDVAPLEEAEAIAKLVKDYDGDTAAAAHAIGKTGKSGQRFVQIALNLVEKLTPEVKEALRDGTINKEMARNLTVADHARQRILLRCVQDGNIRNGKEMRERMRFGNFPATRALFGRLEYNGPVVEDPDSDAVIFTDIDMVKKLQIEAMQERAASYRASCPVVKVILEDHYWDPSNWRATEEGFYPRNKVERMPPDAQRAVVLVLRNDLSVSIFDDLIKMPPPPTSAAGKKQAAKASGDVLADFPTGAKVHARRCRTMALQRALFAERGWRTILAHLCLNLLDGNLDYSPMLAVRADHRGPDLRAVDPEIADVINEFRENLEFQKGKKLFNEPDTKEPNLRVLSEAKGEYSFTKARTGPIVLEALYDLEDGDLLELSMALLASRCGTWHGNGVNGQPDIGDQDETLSACKQLGLTHAVADDAGAIHWPAYLDKLNGPALDVVARRLELRQQQHARPLWPEATQKDKKRILFEWTADRPDKAAYVPAIFHFGTGADIDAAMREEANVVRQPAKAAE